MFAHLTRQGIHPRTAALRAGARLRRCAAALAAVTVGLLASAATIPAAFARDVPRGYYGTTSVAPVPAAPVHAATTGGVAGWQITLIALGAALIAAAVTVVLARARAAHRAAPSPAA
jgi:hypothetical protein